MEYYLAIKKKKWSTVTCYSMGDLENTMVSESLVTQDLMTYDPIHMNSRTG